MDETSGTTINEICDQSCGVQSPPFNMTTYNTPTPNQAGVSGTRGTSWLFTAASSEYADTLSNGTGTGVTDYQHNFIMGCWAKTTDVTGNTAVMSSNADSYANAVSGSAQARYLAINFLSSNVIFRMFTSVASGNNTLATATGATTLANNTWYFLVGRWLYTSGAPTPLIGTIQIFLNGIVDGTTAVNSATAASGQLYINIANKASFDAPQFLDGNVQDCFAVKTSYSAADIKIIYDNGVGTTDNWPYTVKRPELPRYITNPNWLTALVQHGYNTGLFSSRALRPKLMTLGFLPFSALPRGDFGK